MIEQHDNSVPQTPEFEKVSGGPNRIFGITLSGEVWFKKRVWEKMKTLRSLPPHYFHRRMQ